MAHPDDMEFLAGGTVRKMIEQGDEVRELIVTNGERGSYELSSEKLVEERRKEAREAASTLGLKSVTFLEYPDGMLADYRFNEIREKLMAQIRKTRSDTIITWDPFAPYENHPDHRITGMAATEAAGFANLPLYHPEQIASRTSLPHITQSYYIAKHHIDPNHIVDITEQIERKVKALCCHRTQMEFMITDIIRTLKAQGAPRKTYDGIEPKRYRTLVEAAIRKHDSEIGKRAGFRYAEEFRLSQSDELHGFIPNSQE